MPNAGSFLRGGDCPNLACGARQFMGDGGHCDQAWCIYSIVIGNQNAHIVPLC
jgi:hypothetical protein